MVTTSDINAGRRRTLLEGRRRPRDMCAFQCVFYCVKNVGCGCRTRAVQNYLIQCQLHLPPRHLGGYTVTLAAV